jgi:proton-dependent oligopeptide transporter, POT family
MSHPKQLYLLFFTEMWERFSFYGMRALLLLYMVTQLKFDEPKSYAILASYSGLVYTMPIFGGMLADKVLGFRKAILWGGILMTIGHLVLAIPQGWSFFYGMAFIICGNGFFKPNISSLVGTLYEKDDPRKDSAFSIFYMGINFGALFGGILCGYVGQRINWHLGFGLAGFFMILGLVIFSYGQKQLGNRGLPPETAPIKSIAGLKPDKLIYICTLLALPLIVLLFHQYGAMDWIMLGLGILSVIYIVYISSTLEKTARFKLLAALVMIIASVVFWSFYEQTSGSLNLFATRNVNMHFLGMELAPLSVNNGLPPFWVISLSLVFAWLWLALNKRGWEPGTPVKFALSFLFLAGGYAVFYWGCTMNTGGVIPLLFFVFGYFVIICGELCLSPIGLSMITKLAPAKMVGMMMGIWFLATAIGNFLAGKIGALMAVPGGTTNAVETLPYYSAILKNIALGSLAVSVLLFLVVPLLKKWMKDVR